MDSNRLVSNYGGNKRKKHFKTKHEYSLTIMSKIKLYTLILLASVAGNVWLYFNLNRVVIQASESVNICIIKHTTGQPCPSCGSTRSAMSFLQGNFADSLYWNPMGVLLLAILILLPVWIIFDLISGKSSFYRFYHNFEKWLRQPKVAIVAITLVLANWIWYITKGL